MYRIGETNHCEECGRSWSTKDKYSYFPIRVKWAKKRHKEFFSIHGVQVGWADVDVRLFKTVVRIWRFVFIVGVDKYEEKIKFIPQKQIWLPKEQAEKLERHYQTEKELDAIAEKYAGILKKINDRGS